LAFGHKGRYDRAIADYDAAIRLTPDDWIALRGRCYAQAIFNRTAPAVADCDRALQLRPDDPSALSNRGFAYLRGHDYERAIADYDAAIRRFAASEVGAAAAWFCRGVAKSQLGKRELAEQDFRQALALDPGVEAKMSKFGLVR